MCLIRSTLVIIYFVLNPVAATLSVNDANKIHSLNYLLGAEQASASLRDTWIIPRFVIFSLATELVAATLAGIEIDKCLYRNKFNSSKVNNAPK